MMLRVAGALVEAALGLALAVVALAALGGRGPLRRVAARRGPALALAVGGLAFAVWGVGEALRGPIGTTVQLGALTVLVAAAVVLVATLPSN